MLDLSSCFIPVDDANNSQTPHSVIILLRAQHHFFAGIEATSIGIQPPAAQHVEHVVIRQPNINVDNLIISVTNKKPIRPHMMKLTKTIF